MEKSIRVVMKLRLKNATFIKDINLRPDSSSDGVSGTCKPDMVKLYYYTSTTCLSRQSRIPRVLINGPLASATLS